MHAYVYVLDGIATANGGVGISGLWSSPYQMSHEWHNREGPETAAGLFWYCCKQFHFISLQTSPIASEIPILDNKRFRPTLAHLPEVISRQKPYH
jgi:hypothetical protein